MLYYYYLDIEKSNIGILSVIDSNNNQHTFTIQQDAKIPKLSNILSSLQKNKPSIIITYNKKQDIIEYFISQKIYIYRKEYKAAINNLICIDLMSLLNMHETNKESKIKNLSSYALKRNIYIKENYSNLDEAIETCKRITQAIKMLTDENDDSISLALNYAVKNNLNNIKLTPTKIIMQAFIDKHNITMPTSYPSNNVLFKNLNVNKNFQDFTQIYEKLCAIDFSEYDENIKYFIKNIAISIKKTGVYYNSGNYQLVNSNNTIAYIDFKSFFSSIMLKYNIVPYYFNEVKNDFLKYISDIVRLKDTSQRFGKLYKKVLLNIVGLFNHPGIFYSPHSFYEITMNGIYEMLTTIEEITKLIPTIKFINIRVDGMYVEINKLQKDILIEYINNKNNNDSYLKLGIEFYDKAYIDKSSGFMLIKECDAVEAYIDENTFLQNLNNVFNDYNKKVFYHNGKYYYIKFSDLYNTTYLSNKPLISKYVLIYRLIFDGSVLKIIVNPDNDILLYAYIQDCNNSIICSDGTTKNEADKKNILVVNTSYNNCVLQKHPTLTPIELINKNTKINYNYYVDIVNNTFNTDSLLF